MEFNHGYNRHAALMRKLAHQVPGLHVAEPQGTFYMWCRYDLPMPAAQLHERMLERGVGVRTGSEYGSDGEHHIRLSFSVSEAEIEQGMAVVADVMRELQEKVA
jgi:aspartate aminotransferase